MQDVTLMLISIWILQLWWKESTGKAIIHNLRLSCPTNFFVPLLKWWLFLSVVLYASLIVWRKLTFILNYEVILERWGHSLVWYLLPLKADSYIYLYKKIILNWLYKVFVWKKRKSQAIYFFSSTFKKGFIKLSSLSMHQGCCIILHAVFVLWIDQHILFSICLGNENVLLC